MPIHSRSSLAALMTVSLAVAAPLVFTQIDTAQAQSGGSAGSGGGSGTGGSAGTGGSSGAGAAGTGAAGATTPGAGDRNSAADRGTGNRSGMGNDRSPMSGSTGSDATMPGSSRGTMNDRTTTGADSGLVGTEKLSAALGALEGSEGTRARRAGMARLVAIEEYETAMRNALAVDDPAQRSAAVASARERLQQATSRTVTSDTVARVDSILGLPATPMR